MDQRKSETNTEKPKKTPDKTQTPPQTDNVKEIGGPKGPEPTRYGDWDINGRCSDF